MKVLIRVIVFFIIVWIVSTLLYGCGIERATERVILNPSARYKVWAIQSVLTPCVRDSFVQFIEGDTLRISDTVNISHIDTVDNFYHYTDTVKVTHRFTVHDTVKVNILDRAALDTISNLKRVIASKDGVIQTLKDGNKTERNSHWIYIAIIALLCIAFGLIVKFKL